MNAMTMAATENKLIEVKQEAEFVDYSAMNAPSRLEQMY
jgi:hypothetical protein